MGDEPVHVIDFAGTVFVSSGTVRLADGAHLSFEERGRREVKGLERPIEVYRIRA